MNYIYISAKGYRHKKITRYQITKDIKKYLSDYSFNTYCKTAIIHSVPINTSYCLKLCRVLRVYNILHNVLIHNTLNSL